MAATKSPEELPMEHRKAMLLRAGELTRLYGRLQTAASEALSLSLEYSRMADMPRAAAGDLIFPLSERIAKLLDALDTITNDSESTSAKG